MIADWKFPQVPLKYLLTVFGVLVLLYSAFSYSQTDPNLVLTTWSPYWQFQQWMWQTFFENAVLSTWTYTGLLVGLFTVYIWIFQVLQSSSLEYQLGWKQQAMIYGLLAAPLLFSYNALSHDVFNYIFNAKMVLVYGANPHTQVALDFAADTWVRFMHNTHTSAPYWYGWTAISLIPYALGAGKFILTWLAFRIWSVISVVLLYFVLRRASQVFTGRSLQTYQAALVFLNPLFMIEIISNMHNDLWMLVPAVLSLVLAVELDPKRAPQAPKLALVVALLLVSISVKLATVVLLPILILIILEKNFLFTVADTIAAKLPVFKSMPAKFLLSLESYIHQYIPVVAACLLFLPLLTPRSQQFHPWYWTWVLVWVPFIENKVVKNVIILFSVSSMLRYLPWLLAGGFEGSVLLQQKLITWVPVLFYIAWRFFPSAIVTSTESSIKR